MKRWKQQVWADYVRACALHVCEAHGVDDPLIMDWLRTGEGDHAAVYRLATDYEFRLQTGWTLPLEAVQYAAGNVGDEEPNCFGSVCVSRALDASQDKSKEAEWQRVEWDRLYALHRPEGWSDPTNVHLVTVTLQVLAYGEDGGQAEAAVRDRVLDWVRAHPNTAIAKIKSVPVNRRVRSSKVSYGPLPKGHDLESTVIDTGESLRSLLENQDG